MILRAKHFQVLILIALFAALSSHSHGQTNPSNVNMIPNIAPPSPDVAKLMQFGNYPVNHYTGLANISIPLFEIKAGDISVPISLNYHTAGIKVTERSGWAGLGWSLEPGGSISRTVMGFADEQPAGYLSDTTVHYSIDSDDASDLLYLNSIVRGNRDVEPDVYSYSFGGYSGKFVFNQSDDWSKIMIPYAPVKIEHEYDEYDLDFVATDPYGVQYQFNSIHEASSGINDLVSVRSAWKIYQIISSDKQDTVKFSYSSSTGRTFTDISDRIVVEDKVYNPTNTSYFSASDGSTQSTTNIVVTGTEQKLTEIMFPTGKVTFSLSARTDDGWSDTTNGTQKKLDSLSVYQLIPATGAYERIRVIFFDYGTFTSTDGSSTKRLKLDSLRIYDGSVSTLEQKYSFDYNTTYILPDHLSRGRDLWGYYNGLTNNSSLVPRTTISYQALDGGTIVNKTIGSNYTDGRDPDPTYMDACLLNKITYPTGGWTEFDYETNEYLEDSTPTYAGGLRVSQIKSYTESGSLAKTKTYKYGSSESGYGTKNFTTGYYWLVNEVYVIGYYSELCADQPHKTSRTYLSSPSISIEPYDGSPVIYTEVTEYNGTTTTNKGKTVYKYNYHVDQINSTFQTGYPAIESKHYNRGLLTSTATYSNATGNPITSKKTTSYCAYADSSMNNIGLKVKKTILTHDDTALGTGDACNGDGDVYSYTWAYFDIKTGDNKPVSSSTYTYSSTDTSDCLVSSTSQQYENYSHQQVTKTTTTNSDDVSHIKEVDYIQDVTSTAVLDSMENRHMLAYPVKEISKVGTNTIETITRDYHNPSTNLYKIEEISREIGSGSAISEVEFQEYDTRGNILQYEAKDGSVTSFIWAYNDTKPIAQIINAEETEVYHNSFEEDGTVSSSAVTGDYIKSISSAYSISKTIDAGDYLLSYFWRQNSSSAWQLQTEEVTHSSGSITTDKTSGEIDELRLHPKDALMTTFTQDLLLGVTSTTDPNNQTTVYGYDDIGRLVSVTDSDGNLIQEAEYHYVNQ